MVTEVFNVAFRSTGAPVIKRQIDSLGEAANRATRGFFLLQRAMLVIGGFGIIRGLVTYTDALTNMENRLKLTTTSTKNLEAVQSALFDAANRSRTGVRELGDIYSRVALSTRQLGISQKETIEFTERLAKASILSGASTREANAALIQLGQGLASNRLSGDELRSVLEQLPFVADIIAKRLKITRGELRKFGRDGKISAEVVLNAFKDSAAAIDLAFAKTNPTIGQAFTVAENNLLRYIDAIDDATEFSTAFANAIIAVSQNLEIVVVALGLIAAKFAIAFGASLLGKIAAFRIALIKSGSAAARFNVINAARAKISLENAAATTRELAIRRAEIALTAKSTATKLADARAEFAQAQAAFSHGRARDLNTGRFITSAAGRARLTQATIALNAAEAANAALTRSATVNRTALTVAENSATAARSRLTAATAAQATMVGRLSANFPLLTGAIRGAGGAFRGLLALVGVTGPFGILIAIIATLIGAFVAWGNEIKVTSDGVVGLKDATIAAFELMAEAIVPVADVLIDEFDRAIDIIALSMPDLPVSFESVMNATIGLATLGVNLIIATFVGGFRAIVAVWNGLPTAFQNLGNRAARGLASAIETAINTISRGVVDFLAFIGGAAELVGADNPFAGLKPFEVNLSDNLGAGVGTDFANLGETAADAFTSAFTGNYVGDLKQIFGENLEAVSDEIIERARKNIEEAEKLRGKITTTNTPGTTTPGTTGPGGGGKNQKTFAQLIAEIEKEIITLSLANDQREIQNGLLKIEKQLKRELSEEERSLATATLERLEIAKEEKRILEELRGPQKNFETSLKAAQQLFEDGRISAEEYATAIRKIGIEADRASNTLAGGFTSAVASSVQSAFEFGQTLGGFLVDSVGKLTDSVIDFANGAKVNFKDLIKNMLTDLAKLAAKQFLLQIVNSLINPGSFSLFGGGGGGFAGGGIIPGFQDGGSILPSGPGNTDSDLVLFKKRPDERVDILTPQQQRQRKDGIQKTVTNEIRVNAPIVVQSDVQARDFKASQSQIEARLNQAVSRGMRNI